MLNEQKCCCGCSNEDSKVAKVKEIIKTHRDMKGGLIPVLQQIQRLYNYLPEDMLQLVSNELNVPMSEIYGVASFYSFFALEPKGKHIIRVCLGTACYVKGSQRIMDKVSELLNIPVGKTTSDNRFTLEATRCLGACGLAPVMMIDDRVFGRLTPDMIPDILKEFD
jgi:NADH:ubiquinone oxidoreductase subunit E